MMSDYKWRFLVPLNPLERNGTKFLTNRDNTILKINEKEDLNRIFQTEFDFEGVDFNEIHKNQTFYDWVEDNFPLLHELEYELAIYHHHPDIIDWFDGNYFYIGERFDGLKVLISRYKNDVGTFAIVGNCQTSNENVLKYVDREVPA